uniref:SCP domain-containing protein n=1 Tax=Parastrongyloides trichosuri TaxID=131310 RepID=A0A0N4Z082_PARTI
MENELGIKKRQPSIEEDDNISIVHYTSFKKIFCSILIRLVLAAIFLGIAIGALIYAFNNAEVDKHNNHGSNIPGDTYSMFISQNCSKGFMKIEEKLPKANTNDSQQFRVTKIGSSWYQDDSKKRIVHRIGLENDDWMYTYYIYKDHALLDMPNSCTKLNNVTYESYIYSMGLIGTRKIEDSIGLQNGSAIVPTLEYENTPASDVIYNNTHPTVTNLYLNENSYASLRWDLHFYEKSTTSNLASYLNKDLIIFLRAICMEANGTSQIKICCALSVSATCPANYAPTVDLNGQNIYCSVSNNNVCPTGSECLQSPTQASIYICCKSTSAPVICPNDQNALITNGILERCNGPQNSCSKNGYTCQYSTTINGWVCCGEKESETPMCKNGMAPYTAGNGEPYTCSLSASSCPVGYNCEQSTLESVNVCCPTTTEPITTTTTSPYPLSCPNNWNPYRYFSGNYHICNSVSDTSSCPFGYSCVPANINGVFICCRYSMSFECSVKNSTLLVNNQPRLCATTILNSCPYGYDCLPSTIDSINICCKKASILSCRNGRQMAMINGNPQYCQAYGYQSTCPYGYICDHSNIVNMNVCCYAL